MRILILISLMFLAISCKKSPNAINNIHRPQSSWAPQKEPLFPKVVLNGTLWNCDNCMKGETEQIEFQENKLYINTILEDTILIRKYGSSTVKKSAEYDYYLSDRKESRFDQTKIQQGSKGQYIISRSENGSLVISEIYWITPQKLCLILNSSDTVTYSKSAKNMRLFTLSDIRNRTLLARDEKENIRRFLLFRKNDLVDSIIYDNNGTTIVQKSPYYIQDTEGDTFDYAMVGKDNSGRFIIYKKNNKVSHLTIKQINGNYIIAKFADGDRAIMFRNIGQTNEE